MQKQFISSHLSEGDTAVDFTMGNGYDTVFLSRSVGKEGRVTAFDIQPSALLSASKNLRSCGCPENWRLVCASHERAPEFVRDKIKAGMFNLGYLPGSGNKSVTTSRVTTLAAVKNAIEMLDEDAVLTTAVYPGHPEGRAEGELLTNFLASLSRFRYSVSEIRMANSPDSPFFFAIETPKKK